MSLRKTRYLSFTLRDIENKVTLRDDLKPYTKTSRDTAKEKGLKRPLGASLQLGQLFTRRPWPLEFTQQAVLNPSQAMHSRILPHFPHWRGGLLGWQHLAHAVTETAYSLGQSSLSLKVITFWLESDLLGQKVSNLKLLDDAYKLLLNSLHVACHFFISTSISSVVLLESNHEFLSLCTSRLCLLSPSYFWADAQNTDKEIWRRFRAEARSTKRWKINFP